MKLPRDLSGKDVAQALKRFGYQVTRQTSSHMRLTTHERGEHHITIPTRDPLRVGTLAAVLAEVADHLQLTREEVARQLFSKGR